jgi:hypothetical protein
VEFIRHSLQAILNKTCGLLSGRAGLLGFLRVICAELAELPTKTTALPQRNRIPAWKRALIKFSDSKMLACVQQTNMKLKPQGLKFKTG